MRWSTRFGASCISHDATIEIDASGSAPGDSLRPWGVKAAPLRAVAACGGGRSSSGDASLSIDMTPAAMAVNPSSVDVRWTAPPSSPTRHELYVDGTYLGSNIGSTCAPLTGLVPGTRMSLSSRLRRSRRVTPPTPAAVGASRPSSR
jgi:hypothetical protein